MVHTTATTTGLGLGTAVENECPAGIKTEILSPNHAQCWMPAALTVQCPWAESQSTPWLTASVSTQHYQTVSFHRHTSLLLMLSLTDEHSSVMLTMQLLLSTTHHTLTVTHLHMNSTTLNQYWQLYSLDVCTQEYDTIHGWGGSLQQLSNSKLETGQNQMEPGYQRW